MRLIQVIIVLALFCCGVFGVDRGNFKTCDQSSFCRRNRGMSVGASHYVALLESAEISHTALVVNLLNKQNNVLFRLQLTGLDGDMFRFQIRELQPLRERYEAPIGDVLVAEPIEKGIRVEKANDHLNVVYDDHTIKINADPFHVDVIQGDVLIITLNSKGLMKFEHTRQKDQQQNPGSVDAQNAENKEDDSKDAWEEHFKSHTDSKPHGPTSVGIDIGFPRFEYVYGIPEHADTLALKGTKSGDPYRLYNLDVFEYELHNPMALYGSVPYMIAHSGSKTVGAFWPNPSEMWIDISNNKADRNVFTKVVDYVKGDTELPQVDTHWFAESGNLDFFILLGPTPADVFKQYAQLTGTTQLPPLFALGYHQSRWNYNDEQDVINLDENFDKYDIPLDCIWLDIEHTDGKRYFTWDKSKFPHPGDMIRNISTKGRKMVTIIDPHIKRDSNWDLHKEAESYGYYIKNKDGGDFDGWCWPGSSSYLDFLNPDIRKWWAGRFAPSLYEGSSNHLFTWNDMNEPSVFNGPEVTMHKDCKHVGDREHREVHNLYGTYQVMATMQGQLDRSKGAERPFVLSRAFFAGTQRFGAVWTGDNLADWNHLKISLPMIMSLSLAGITFSGADVGGFFQNPDPELLTRWYQAAAYQPFFRAHAHLDTRRREPWLLPDSNRLIIREAVRARYALLPYWYTLFYEAEKHGGPIMKPLWVDFITDTHTFDMEDQHLIGSALLIHPVTSAGASSVSVYLPGSETIWYDTESVQSYKGGESHSVAVTLRSIPVFQKGGTIVPRKDRIRRSSILGRYDPYTLYVALDKNGFAAGSLYIDDYHTFRYKNKLEFIHRRFTFKQNKLENTVLTKGSKYATKSWLEKVIIFGLEKKPSRVEVSSPHISSLPLAFGYLAEKKMLVVRKPGVNIGVDWSIALKN